MNPLQSAVRGGQRPASSAALHNQTVDAVRRSRSQRNVSQVTPPLVTPPSGLVRVRNVSGVAVGRFDVLAIAGVAIEPEANELEFQNRPIVDGVRPTSERRSFVILTQPLASGAIGRAIAVGVTVVRLFVPDVDPPYPFSFADTREDQTGYLLAVTSGPASILWREEGTGELWALVSVGTRRATSPFTVILEQTGGDGGDEFTGATWTYTVRDPDRAEEDNTIAEDVNPNVDPHQWVRPSVGYMKPATLGYAHTNSAGDLVIGWTNEIAEQERCTG